MTDGKPCCVYKVTRIETGECYIGISIHPERRWRRTYAARFANALNKHGREAFDWQVLFELPTQFEAQLAEMCLIYTEEPAYNATIGGDGRIGVRHSAETRAKMSAARAGKPKLKMRGYKQTPEHVANAAKSRKGRPSPMKGRKLTTEQLAKRVGRPSPLRGVKHTVDRRRINSLAHMGKKHTPETRAKMSASHKKRFPK